MLSFSLCFRTPFSNCVRTSYPSSAALADSALVSYFYLACWRASALTSLLVPSNSLLWIWPLVHQLSAFHLDFLSSALAIDPDIAFSRKPVPSHPRFGGLAKRVRSVYWLALRLPSQFAKPFSRHELGTLDLARSGFVNLPLTPSRTTHFCDPTDERFSIP